MFSSAKSESEFKKLPTLNQYLKGIPKREKLPDRYVVTKMWYPNKFPNFSIETEYFIVRVPESNPLSDELIEMWETMEEEEWCLTINIINRTTCEYLLDRWPSESCEWRELGKYGRELKVKDKPKSRKGSKDPKRDSRKPEMEGVTLNSAQDDLKEASK